MNLTHLIMFQFWTGASDAPIPAFDWYIQGVYVVSKDLVEGY